MALAIIGLISTAVTAKAASKARKQAAAARTEDRNIARADQTNTNRLERRKAIRSARIQRAQVASVAEQTGATGSTAAQQASTDLTAGIARGVAGQSGAVRTADARSAQQQNIANAQDRAQSAIDRNKVFQAGLSVASDEFGPKKG